MLLPVPAHLRVALCVNPDAMLNCHYVNRGETADTKVGGTSVEPSKVCGSAALSGLHAPQTGARTLAGKIRALWPNETALLSVLSPHPS